jgi:hypothetical protein
MCALIVGITEPPVFGLEYSRMIPSYGEPSEALAAFCRAA